MSVWFIQRDGVEISIRLRSKPARELLEPIMLGLRAVPSEQIRGELIVAGGKPGAWQLIDKSDDVRRELTLPGDLIYHLTDRVVFHIANNASSQHCIHAGAVAHSGGVLIVPAKSGAGKSSFTCWLAANGFDYITDELILIDADQTISGVGRPIQIKSNGIEAIKPLLTAPDYAKGNLANAVPVESFGGRMVDAGENRLAAFVFPRYSSEADFEFSELSSAEAGLELMNNHVNARNLEGHGFRQMMALIRSTPRYALNYGGFNKLPEDFADQLKQLCARTL